MTMLHVVHSVLGVDEEESDKEDITLSIRRSIQCCDTKR
jgi:hypothetical protein